ncbi:MAG: hypothetical protein KDA91_07525 [Planctomycetaceae bacterium]|nr:hypothetical protein [Planctomycetaceae bacterium]
MRFRSKGQPRGILHSRDQRRLTLAIFGIGLLAILISAGARPGFWAFFTGKQPSATQEDVAGNASIGSRTLAQDEIFISSNQYSQALDANEAARHQELSGLPAAESVSRDNLPRIPEALLEPIQDDVIGIRKEEAESYFASLRLAADLKGKSIQNVPEGYYAVFMTSPDECRGRPWTLKGQLRRLDRLQNDANSFGLKTLYDAWVSLPDSGNRVVHVVAVAADNDLPLAVQSAKEPPLVEFTAYFYKREGYFRKGSSGEGDVGLTPLLLTGRLRKFVAPVSTSNGADELTPWLSWLALIVSCGVALVIWQFKVSDSLFRRTRTHQLTTLPVRVSFEGVNSVTVDEMLRDMQANADSTPQLPAI